MIRLLRAIRIWWQCMPLEQELCGHQHHIYDLQRRGHKSSSEAIRLAHEEMAILRARIAKIKAS